jgi:hypothetical protein
MGRSEEEGAAGTRSQYLGLKEGEPKMGVGQSGMKYSGSKSDRWHIIVFLLPYRLSPPPMAVGGDGSS